MKFPLSWLNDYVDIKDIPAKEYAHELTMSGSKVEGVENAGRESGKHSDSGRSQHGRPDAEAGLHHHNTYSAAGTHCPVDGQIRDIQNSERQIDADRHDAPDKSLCSCSWQCIDQVHNIHSESPPDRQNGGRGSILSRCMWS